jgi:hypothetical protein
MSAMLEFLATFVAFTLAILGLAAGMLLGRRGLRGGCHGESADASDDGCGRPGCCQSAPGTPEPAADNPRRQGNPPTQLVQLRLNR